LLLNTELSRLYGDAIVNIEGFDNFREGSREDSCRNQAQKLVVEIWCVGVRV